MFPYRFYWLNLLKSSVVPLYVPTWPGYPRNNEINHAKATRQVLAAEQNCALESRDCAKGLKPSKLIWLCVRSTYNAHGLLGNDPAIVTLARSVSAAQPMDSNQSGSN